MFVLFYTSMMKPIRRLHLTLVEKQDKSISEKKQKNAFLQIKSSLFDSNLNKTFITLLKITEI